MMAGAVVIIDVEDRLGRISISALRNVRNLRQRVLLAAGLALFATGTAILAVGLIGYFDNDKAVPPEVSMDIADLLPDPPKGIEDVPGLPVSVPYYNPYPRVTAPLRIVVERIKVDAPIVELGLDGGGVPQVPLNGNDVAWYNFSAKPGAGSNAVFAGHVNWAGALGAFGRIDRLEKGDTVRLIADDGRQFTYEVFANYKVDPADPESLKVMAPTPTDTVTLITCGGTWIPDPSERFGGEYTNRTIVQGKLVDSSLAVPSQISGG